MTGQLSPAQVQLCLAMTEAAARDFVPDAYAQDFPDYARVFRALGHPPDFDPKAEDAQSAGALDVLLLDGLGLATLGHIAVYVLGVLADLGIEKTAEHGSERAWHWFRRKRKEHEEHEASVAAGDSSAVPAPGPDGQPDVAEVVTTVTSRLPRNWAGQDGAVLEAVVEVQVKTYLRARREQAGSSAEEG